MNNYLKTGQKCGTSNANVENVNDDCDIAMSGEQSNIGESSALNECNMITSNQPKTAIDIDNVIDIIQKTENATSNTQATASEIGAIDSNVTEINNKSDIEVAGGSQSQINNKNLNKCGIVIGPDPTKPLKQKAKVLRQQRKLEKQLAKANSSMSIDSGTIIETSKSKKIQKNVENTLQSLIDSTLTDGVHQLKVSSLFFALKIEKTKKCNF